MSPVPLLLSPALPSELLTYVLDHHVYPTTLVICSSMTDYLRSLQHDLSNKNIPRHNHPESSDEAAAGESERPEPDSAGDSEEGNAHDQLLLQTLSYLAISRHIRTVYIPTVTHLRSWASVFSPEDGNVTGPPSNFTPPGRKCPTLIVSGVIELHRDTSEWSAQGLGNTMAALVETADRLGWSLVMAEQQSRSAAELNGVGEREASQELTDFGSLLEEKMPILSGSARRAGLNPDEGGWSGRTVQVGRAMSRWFKFRYGPWDDHNGKVDEETPIASEKNPDTPNSGMI